jgi:hypothetical protein
MTMMITVDQPLEVLRVVFSAQEQVATQAVVAAAAAAAAMAAVAAVINC